MCRLFLTDSKFNTMVTVRKPTKEECAAYAAKMRENAQRTKELQAAQAELRERMERERRREQTAKEKR